MLRHVAMAMAVAVVCELLTVFEGRLSGDRLEGTYTSRRPDGQTQRGRWEVTRRGA